MTAATVYEILGFLASGLIVISITQKSIFRLRVVGLCGSLTFLTYGLLISAYPIVVVNAAATAIHLWYLKKLTADSAEVFRALPVRPESNYLRAFLEYHKADIRHRFQPEFDFDLSPNLITAFVLRDMVPAGLFIGRRTDDGRVEALLDFASPEYRDFRIAEFLFSNKAGLFDERDHEVFTHATAPAHIGYLRRVGFTADPTEPGMYRHILTARKQA